MDYDTPAIRQFLLQHFNDTELRALCLDNFRDVYQDFTTGMGKRQMVHSLIEHCLNHGRIPDLLAALKRERPQLYAQHIVSEQELQPQRPVPLPPPSPPNPRQLFSPDVFVHPETGKEMVRVPAGDFLFGEDKEKITLDEYWIDRTPVTNAEYSRFVAAVAHEPPRHWQGQTPPSQIADHPLGYVSWHYAKAYADWAGLRVPTEQEWEKAARGTDGRVYPWGNEWRDNHCNTRESGIGATTPVGRFSPQGDSPYGCVDMAGNVWEWTDSPYDGAKDWRVVRGGSWDSSQLGARVAYRFRARPFGRYGYVGFRTVVHRPL